MCIHNASGLSMQLNTRPANKWKKKKTANLKNVHTNIKWTNILTH